VSGDGGARTLSELFRWSGRRAPVEAVPSAPPPAEPLIPSLAFPKFLNALEGRPNPSLLDFGPVVGSNITFFGDRLGCKIFIEDFFSEIRRAERIPRKEDEPDPLLTLVGERFGGRDATMDGVLCWDVFDHLDRSIAQALAQHVTRIVRPGGAVLGFFGTSERDRVHFTKFVIEDEGRLRARVHVPVRGRTRVLQSRDIIRMFEGLRVVEQILLKSGTREILFRKA
jgi:hypothetical protein